MPQTKISGPQISDNSVTESTLAPNSITRPDLNTGTSGKAVIAKVIEGTGLSVSSTGADAGTGDVTLSLKVASASQLGGIKIGSGISVDANGFISVTSVSATANQLVYGTGTGVTSSGEYTIATDQGASNLGVGITASALGSGFGTVNVNGPYGSGLAMFYNGLRKAYIYTAASNDYHMYLTTASGNIVFTPGSGSAMTLHNTGNLNVGGASDTGYKLDVQGTTRLQGNVLVSATGSTLSTLTVQAPSLGGTRKVDIQSDTDGNFIMASGTTLFIDTFGYDTYYRTSTSKSHKFYTNTNQLRFSVNPSDVVSTVKTKIGTGTFTDAAQLEVISDSYATSGTHTILANDGFSKTVIGYSSATRTAGTGIGGIWYRAGVGLYLEGNPSDSGAYGVYIPSKGGNSGLNVDGKVRIGDGQFNTGRHLEVIGLAKFGTGTATAYGNVFSDQRGDHGFVVHRSGTDDVYAGFGITDGGAWYYRVNKSGQLVSAYTGVNTFDGKIKLGTSASVVSLDLEISRATSSTAGISIMNSTASSAEAIYIGENGNSYSSLTRLNSTFSAPVLGTSVAGNNMFIFQNNISGGVSNGPLGFGGSVIYNFGGNTATNYATKLDSTGWRMDLLSNIHNANSNLFQVTSPSGGYFVFTGDALVTQNAHVGHSGGNYLVWLKTSTSIYSGGSSSDPYGNRMTIQSGTIAFHTGSAQRFDIGNSAANFYTNVNFSSAVMMGTGAGRISFAPNVAAFGEIPAGGYIASLSTGSTFMIPSADSGNAGAKVGLGYYTGGSTGWRSAVEIENVASGFGTLKLMRSGGTVEVGTGASNVSNILNVNTGISSASGEVSIVPGSGHLSTFKRWFISGNIAGTSIGYYHLTEVAVAYGAGYALSGLPLMFRASVQYGIASATATDIGTRLDPTGFRVAQQSGLHNSNVYSFEVQGTTMLNGKTTVKHSDNTTDMFEFRNSSNTLFTSIDAYGQFVWAMGSSITAKFGTFGSNTNTRAGFSKSSQSIFVIDFLNTRVGIGGAGIHYVINDPAALLEVRGNADIVQNIVQANGSQTANLVEWKNGSSTNMMQFTGSGSMSIGFQNPTAFLDIKESTTSSAQLRLRQGATPATPNDGDIWFDGTALMIQVGGVTKTISLI